MPQANRNQTEDNFGSAEGNINAGGCRQCATHRRLFVDGLDDKLLIVKGNVSDLTPRKTDLRGQSEEDSARRVILNLNQNHRKQAK